MIADVVDVIGLVLAVLFAGEDAADVRLALGAGAKAGGVGQQCRRSIPPTGQHTSRQGRRTISVSCFSPHYLT